jgi:hypothetical protein
LGGKTQEAFDEIKSYLTSPPVLQAPKSGVPFRLYVAVESSVIGAILTQETDGKEYVVAYESRRLLDAEMRYMLTVQNRAKVHRKPTGDLVPFSPRRVLPRFVNPRIGRKLLGFSI